MYRRVNVLAFCSFVCFACSSLLFLLALLEALGFLELLGLIELLGSLELLGVELLQLQMLGLPEVLQTFEFVHIF